MRSTTYLLMFTLFLSACGSNNNAERSELTAFAGADASATGRSIVTLSGSATGGGTEFSWKQVLGDAVDLSGPSEAEASFQAPAGDQTLIFELTVTDQNENQAKDQVSITVDNQLRLAPSISYHTYSATDPGDFDQRSDCPSFAANWIEPSWDWSVGPLHQINSDSIAVSFGSDYSALSTADAAVMTSLQTDPTLQQNLIDNLDAMRQRIIDEHKIQVNNIVSNDTGLCHRTDMFVRGTLIWNSDTYAISGAGTAGYANRIAYMEVPHTEVINMTVANADSQRTIPHEYIHTLQFDLDRGIQEGWQWYVESFATFVSNDLGNTSDYLPGYHIARHWGIDSAMTRYNTWVFWWFLGHTFGREFTADILQRRADPDENLFEFIRRVAPFDCAADDAACRDQAMTNLYAAFANSTANYGIYSTGLNMDVRSYALDGDYGLYRQSDYMIEVSDNRYRPADWLAPQRFAHNIIELVPDPESDWLSITLEPWQIPNRESDWRATLIATLDESVVPPVEARQPMFSTGTQHVNLAQWQQTLGSDIQRLELVIAAAPGNEKNAQELPAFSGPYRFPELDRYVYELTLDGAWPKGHEPDRLREAPSESGANHANGGGFVADTASVDSSAYIGPEARVLGYAQVRDSARIEGRATIAGNAIVRDDAIVSSSASVRGSAIVEGFATVRDNVDINNSVQLSAHSKLQGSGYFYGSFNVTDQAFAGGFHMNTTTSNATMSGTALSNGHSWIDSGDSLTTGGPYDGPSNYWSEDNNGLLLHYDFETDHVYRVKDEQLDQDAYFLGIDATPLTALPLLENTTLSSRVLNLTQQGFLELPRHLVDQTSYALALKFNWSGNSVDQTDQYLLDAANEAGEQLAIRLLPGLNDSYRLQLVFTDRDGQTLNSTLTDNMLLKDEWINLELNYSASSGQLSLQSTTLDLAHSHQVTLTLPYHTRAFEHDTLRVRLGAPTNYTLERSLNSNELSAESLVHAQIDDIQLSR